MPSPYRRFLSTPSARRATQHRSGQAAAERISIHALREEGDSPGSTTTAAGNNFYPRPPRGGRLEHIRAEVRRHQISIHALREEGDIWKALCWSRPILISIHALREEGDLPKKCRALPPPYFYPRPPRGGRQWQDKLIAFVQQFLSTPSARRATLRTARASCCRTNFYPRPPRGGRQRLPLSAEPLINFYPRPPRGGRPRCSPKSSAA